MAGRERIGAFAALILVAGACGGDPSASRDEAGAERFVRETQREYCRQEAGDVRCRERGDSWLCSFDVAGGQSTVSVPKVVPDHPEMQIIC